MLSTYNRKILKTLQTKDELKVYYDSHEKTGLEWNQYIGRIIVNDFIKKLEEHDGTDFATYLPVLSYIEYGLFQSAINVIQQINLPEIADEKAWLLKSLAEGEDRYE